MNKVNIQKRLKEEFEFIGDEQVSGNTALKIVNDIFNEAQRMRLCTVILTDK